MAHAFSNERTKRSVRRTSTLLAAVVAVLLPAAPASAAQRYAAEASADTTGPCSSEFAPCRIDHAVNAAAPGDEVIVAPGTYTLEAPLVPAAAVSIRGVADRSRPRLIGSAALLSATVELRAGGSLSHLYIEGNATKTAAVELTGGLGSDLEIYSRDGSGIELKGVTGGTLLRDSVARSGGHTAVETKDGASVGAVTILNVTAVGGPTGIEGKQTAATTIVRNTIARGSVGDVLAVRNSPKLAIDHSNFRPASSSGHTDAGGNQGHVPQFADPIGGDLHVLAGSPTIDAGAIDPALDSFDLDGRPRHLGLAPDMGAYESVPPEPPSGGASGQLPPLLPPVLGESVAVAPARGSVRVKLPGAARFVDLGSGASIPVGAQIDATHGTVKLTSARDAAGTTQTGSFWGGAFRVTQSGRYTDLALTGRPLRCPRGSRSAAAGGDVHSARRTRRSRRLWGRDRRGRFRTRGRNGHAVVRGTKWLTKDRCDGTLFAVAHGAIDVYPKRGRRVRLKAGDRHLVRPPRARRRR